MPDSRLMHARETRGLTLRRLAEISGVAHSTITAIENHGGGRPSTLRRLADALGIRPEWLISGEGDMLPLPPSPAVQADLENPPVGVVLEAARQVDAYLAGVSELPIPGIRSSMVELIAGIMILKGPENPVPESYFATLYRELGKHHGNGQR